mgnify:FL=1
MIRLKKLFCLSMLIALFSACGTTTNKDLEISNKTDNTGAIAVEVTVSKMISDETAEPMITETKEIIATTSSELKEVSDVEVAEDTIMSKSTLDVADTVTAELSIVESTTVPVSTSSVSLDVEGDQDATSEEVDETTNIELGTGGLVQDLEGWAEKDVPQFYTTSHIDVSTLELVSKFRSRAGHDYTDNFEECASLKHYFHPLDFYETALTTPVYAGADGVIVWVQQESGDNSEDFKNNYEKVTGEKVPESYLDVQILHRPDAAPNVWIKYHHVSPIDEIMEEVSVADSRMMMMNMARPKESEYRVRAGDLIAYGLGEISIEQHLDGSGFPTACMSGDSRLKRGNLPGCKRTIKLLSLFDHMTDEVFAEYRELYDVERSDFKNSKEEIAKNPYTCTGEWFDNKGNADDADTYVRLQGGGDEQKLGDEQSNVQASGNVGVIVTSFEGESDGEHGPFEAVDGDVISITSDGGPFLVSVSKEGDVRSIYNRPEGDGTVNYETPLPFAGLVSAIVTAPVGVEWELMVYRRE